MAKKQKRSLKQLREAYKGSISTILITLFIIGFGLFMPMLTANNVEKARTGKGIFTPKSFMFYDLNSESDVDNTNDNLDHIYNGGGTGALGYRYQISNPNPEVIVWQSEIDIIDIQKEGTFEEYAHGVTVFRSGDTPITNPVFSNVLMIVLEIDKDFLIDNDLVKIDIYLEINGISITTLTTVMAEASHSSNGVLLGNVKLSELTSFEVSVSSLLEILQFPTGENIILSFSAGANYIPKMADVYLDVQLYNLRAKTNSIALISLWNVIHSGLIVFLGVVMLPQISFGGLAKRLSLSRGTN